MPYTLSNRDIAEIILRDEKMFHTTGGIFPIDKLPQNHTIDSFYFINTDPSYLPGEHWVGAFFPEKSPPEFFDSIGQYPSIYSENITQFLGEKFIYNPVRLQTPYSSTCGLYCLYYLYHRCRDLPFMDILQVFSKNTNYNDNIVIDFYETIK